MVHLNFFFYGNLINFTLIKRYYTKGKVEPRTNNIRPQPWVQKKNVFVCYCTSNVAGYLLVGEVHWGFAVLTNFSGGISVILILNCGTAVFYK